jgi:N-acyl-phosphatidylethanolamine-hydrolysing phospholipase D
MNIYLIHFLMKKTQIIFAFSMLISCSSYINTKEHSIHPIPKVQQLNIYNKKHHTEDGFKNLYPSPERPFFKSFFWITNKLITGEDKSKIVPADSISVNLDDLKNSSSEYKFWWVGHSTVLVQGPKFTFITDPQFSDRASPVSFAGPIRHKPPAFQIKDIPKIDFVLISHNHYDHLDENSIKTIHQIHDPIFFVPLKVGEILKDWGIQKIVELDWWEYVEIFDFKIYCTPARHFSARSLWDRNKTLWGGWFVEDQKHQFNFYFAGDTGYEAFFKEIHDHIGKPHVALIPIGAFEPRWFMREVHVNPEEAFRAFLDLDADVLFPIHWGTFFLAEERMDLPPKRLKESYENWKKENSSSNKSVKIIKIGEFIKIALDQNYGTRLISLERESK